jgi:hypothetical protein
MVCVNPGLPMAHPKNLPNLTIRASLTPQLQCPLLTLAALLHGRWLLVLMMSTGFAHATQRVSARAQVLTHE